MNCVICDQSNLKIVFKHQKWGEDCLQCPDCEHIHLFNYNHAIYEKDFGTNIKRADYYLDKISKMQFQNILDIGSPSDFYFLKQLLKKTFSPKTPKTFSPKGKNVKGKNVKGKNVKGRNNEIHEITQSPGQVSPVIIPIKKAYAYDLFPHNTPNGIIMISDLSLPKIKKMKIDLSMAIHVLEHIPTLVPFLFDVKQITRYLIIEVPDCSDIKDAVRSSTNPHYNFFTPKSLRTLLETVGLTNCTLSTRIHNGKYKMLVAECKIDHPDHQWGSKLGINKIIDTGHQTIVDLSVKNIPNCKKILRQLFLFKNNISYYPTDRSEIIADRYCNTERVIVGRKNLTQAIELGTGFSPHAINLRNQIKNYIEVDYKENQQLKSQIIKKLYTNVDHIQYVGGDMFLQETWDKIYAIAIDAPTIIFTEGSLEYWSKEKQRHLFLNFIAPMLKKNPQNVFLSQKKIALICPEFVVENVLPKVFITYLKEPT